VGVTVEDMGFALPLCFSILQQALRQPPRVSTKAHTPNG
jgi:hypothetical protein